ncbi:MAG: tetratricopeptide repeat protein [Verrucomicrobiae bacterium]|nr:tetratricopeptide repeat protein [Verrucomicrobiae bacterium]
MSAITKALQKALEVDPSNWETRQALIEAYLSDGQKSQARALIEGIEALPEDESSLIAAAMSYALAGSPAEGQKIANRVLESNPGNAEAHLAMASIAHQGGDKRTAMRHYLTATGIDPNISSRHLDDAYGELLASMAPETEAKTPELVDEEEPTAQEVTAEVDPEPEVSVVSVAEPEPESEPVTVVEEPVVTPITPVKLTAPTATVEPTPKKPTDTEAEVVSAKVEAVEPPLPVIAEAEADADSDAVDVEVSLADEEEVYYSDSAEVEELRLARERAEAARMRTIAKDKLASLTVTILLHAAVFAFLGLVIIATPRDVPPQITATAAPAETEDQIQPQTVEKTKLKVSSAASAATEIVSAANFSSIAIANVETAETGMTNAFAVEFQPSMSFGDTATSMDSKMMFGQKMDGEVLGVILDVSGSMAEYLPAVVREVDASFKNAPIVYVNHAGILGNGKDTEIYPIIEEEVIPYWTHETDRRYQSPYWFLWGDLPRKAEQRYVDRLIETFKKRPNSFIARGGQNRVGAAADFLMGQGIDSLYIFSDFEDFVDEEVCEELGKQLGRSKIKTYVQPAAAKTEHLAVMTRRVAGRSMGRELPPLTELLRPSSTDPAPIAVAEKKAPTPVPEGVKFATVRPEPIGPLVYHFNYWGGGGEDLKTRFKDILKVVEYPNFDVVIRGPEARAYIYMKTKEGYIQNPVVFGYHSRKPYVSEKDGKTYYRWRKWLRNEEEPKMDGDEFTWNMVLEDEIKFQVRFWFKEDTLTGTYAAEFPPEGESDFAHVYFVVPPMARETRDMYTGLDFPKSLSLDDLRLAMTDNIATFYLPAQAEKSLGTTWSRLGFKKGENVCPFNIIYRDLPSGVREVTVSGPSFGPRKLQARTTSNDLLLSTGNRADMELWEGFACRLVRPNDRREGFRKTEAIAFSIE